MSGTPILTPGQSRIGLVARAGADGLEEVVDIMMAFARRHDLQLCPEASLAPMVPDRGPPPGSVSASLDLLVTLGGDGTLLRGARMVQDEGVPILGINMGHLGFMTALSVDEAASGLEAVQKGGAVLDCRFTLEARVLHANGRVGDRLTALNDLVLHKGGVARVMRMGLFTGQGDDRDEIGRFSGDGVIVATPTGSTAYSLSAGGPVVAPSMECVLVTPISAHTLAMRPLVLPSEGILFIEALDRSEDVVVTADGQAALDLGPGDRVRVCRGQTPVRLVRFPGQTFFQTLRRKLNWAI